MLVMKETKEIDIFLILECWEAIFSSYILPTFLINVSFDLNWPAWTQANYLCGVDICIPKNELKRPKLLLINTPINYHKWRILSDYKQQPVLNLEVKVSTLQSSKMSGDYINIWLSLKIDYFLFWGTEEIIALWWPKRHFLSIMDSDFKQGIQGQ